MKKILFAFSAALLLISSCVKEEGKDEGMLTQPKEIIIVASVDDPITRTTVSIEDKVGHYAWEENEKIAVVADNSVGKTFPFVSQDPSAGTFSYTPMPDEDVTNLAFAVTPEDALVVNVGNTPKVENGSAQFRLSLSGLYDYGHSNAVMVAGAPVDNGDVKKFTFKHAAALYRVEFENVPTGTQGLKFVADGANITGTFSFQSLENVEIKGADADANSNEAYVILENPVSEAGQTLEFYVPVPTGTYTDVTVSLIDGEMDEIANTSKTFTANAYTVKRGAIIRIPKITLEPEEEEVTVDEFRLISSGSIADGDYLIAYVDGNTARVFTGVDANLNHSDVTISDGAISATENLNSLAIEIKSVTDGYTLKLKGGDNEGKYLGSASGNNNGTVFSNSEVVNSIDIEDGLAEIKDISNSNTHFVYNSTSNTERFRYYKTTTTTGIKQISLFQKVSQTGIKLNTPTGLKVEGKVVSWSPVNNSDQYVVSVGTTTVTVSECSYTFEGTDDYYDVSVIARASDNSRFDSDAALLTNAKFGTPTLLTPSLKRGAIGENSINVTWTADDRATAGYLCEIKDAGDYTSSKTVEVGSVVFEGLSDDTEYTITVKANKVTEPLEYEASDAVSIVISTAAKTTIKSILDGEDTEAKSIAGVTVLAISTKGVYVGDATGWIFAQQSSTNPTDLAVGDIVNVSGTAGLQNNQRVLKTSTITKSSGTAISIPDTESLDYDALVELVETFERKHISFIGSVTTVNVSSGYYNVALGDNTSCQIALYSPISAITSTIKVGQTVIVSGYTMHITGNTTKYLYIAVDSFSVASISVKTTPASYSFAWDESGSSHKQEFEVESDNANWTIDDSEVSSWASVSKNENKVIIYPINTNESGDDYSGKVYVVHASIPTVKDEIAIEQKDKNSAGPAWTRVSTVSELLAGGTFIIGYEATANSGMIVPMANTGSATTSTAGFMYSGAGASSGNTDTIDMSSVSSTSSYEVTIGASSAVSGAIFIKIGDNYLGNTNTKNNCKLFASESATTAFTPIFGTNNTVTLKIDANETYQYLKYNTGSPRFAVYSTKPENIVIYKKN